MQRPESCGWTLSSSTGRESVSWAVRSIDRDPDGPTLVCDVTLDGFYYDDVLDSGAAEPDFGLTLRSLALRTHELERLVDQLERGLALPPQELRSIALACSMGGLFDQSLRFELGTRDDTLAPDKPVATLLRRRPDGG